MPVLGVGGYFFRARDPEALTAWYAEHLGVGAGLTAGDSEDPDPGPEPDPDEWSWRAQGGPLVFAPFAATTDYWPAEHQVMLNLRVSDLDDLLADLRSDGIAVVTDQAWDSPEVGRFARIHDPEGNPIELWEPASPTRDAPA